MSIEIKMISPIKNIKNVFPINTANT
ncbi:T3SS effector protein NleE, partial [Shigella sonnei]|nr:T3SS effector protein NleE [Shigella sonnei]EFX9368512.1 T3SS effector protein NleE [Shigella flexneri]